MERDDSITREELDALQKYEDFAWKRVTVKASILRKLLCAARRDVERREQQAERNKMIGSVSSQSVRYDRLPRQLEGDD